MSAPRQTITRDTAHEFRRLVQDAVAAASAAQWHRRAAAFDVAAPRPGDFHGRATREQLRAGFDRCKDTAAACLHHADMLETNGMSAAAVTDLDLALVGALYAVRDAA